MDITVNIPDDQWHQFKEVAKKAVETSWDGKYEDFATYIMAVNIETYIKSQQRKQEKKSKQSIQQDINDMSEEEMERKQHLARKAISEQGDNDMSEEEMRRKQSILKKVISGKE